MFKTILVSLLVLTPFVSFADFDSGSYKPGDVVNYGPVVTDQELLWVWLGTDSDLYNFNCDIGLTGQTNQIIPISGSQQCAYDDGIHTGTGPGGSLVITDLPTGKYYYLEPNAFDTCDPSSGDTYNDCEAQGNFVESGSFYIFNPSITSSAVGGIIGNMLAQFVVIFTSEIGIVITFAVSFMVLALLLAYARRFFRV